MSNFFKDTTVEEVLSSFREKWQKELQISPRKKLVASPARKEIEDDHEIKAKTYFLNGVEMEKNGKLYEAIQFYRRAVQLVPDIESRIDNVPRNKPLQEHIPEDENSDKEEYNESDDEDEDEEIKDGELQQRIQKKFSKMSAICSPKQEQKVELVTFRFLSHEVSLFFQTTHISILPMEMILYILRWVVSCDLDLRSLEMFSMVCRGFYLCARDPEVWRLACLR